MKAPELSFSPNLTAGLDLLLDPEGPARPMVYTTDLSVLIYGAKYSGQCNWGIIPEYYFPSGYALALPQYTPFKQHFDKV